MCHAVLVAVLLVGTGDRVYYMTAVTDVWDDGISRTALED